MSCVILKFFLFRMLVRSFDLVKMSILFMPSLCRSFSATKQVRRIAEFFVVARSVGSLDVIFSEWSLLKNNEPAKEWPEKVTCFDAVAMHNIMLGFRLLSIM